MIKTQGHKLVTTRLGESDFTSIFLFSFGLKNEKSGWLCDLNIHNSEQVLKYNHSDQKRNLSSLVARHYF